MFEVGVYEAKKNLPKILRRVERGESVVITRHGKPIIEMNAVAKKKQDTAKALRAFFNWCDKNPVNATLEEMIAWKNEGRV